MKVGSLVECVAINVDKNTEIAKSIIKTGLVTYPKVGGIYTIRAFPLSDGVYLEEIDNSAAYKIEPCFNIKMFRELQPPMDISELIEECQTQTVEI